MRHSQTNFMTLKIGKGIQKILSIFEHVKFCHFPNYSIFFIE